jgi:hypothetical protein
LAAFFAAGRQRAVELPEVVDPVEPVVPVLLVDDEEEGEPYVPEAPMPDVEEGAEAEPLTVPPVEPIPEAVPDAVPVELHAARAAAQRPAKTYFSIDDSCLNLKCMPAPEGPRRTQVQLARQGTASALHRAPLVVSDIALRARRTVSVMPGADELN